MPREDLELLRALSPAGEWVSGTGLKRTARGVFLFRAPAWVKIRPETLSRCTGRKDKSGALIWEGDIVNIHEGKGPVPWLVRFGPIRFLNDRTHVGFYLEFSGNALDRRYFWATEKDFFPNWSKTEICGNIHDKRGKSDDDRCGESLLHGPGRKAPGGPREPQQSEGGRKDSEAAE